MKKLLIIVHLICLSLFLFAQGPGAFNYQGVARTSTGSPAASKTISVRISILNGSAAGTPEYVETHAVNTNPNGLFALQVGNGTVASGTFNTINWASGNKYIKSEVDLNGGTAYTTVASTQILSVPYSMVANELAVIPVNSLVNATLENKIYLINFQGKNATFYYNIPEASLPADASGEAKIQVLKGSTVVTRSASNYITNSRLIVPVKNVDAGDVLTINIYIQGFTGKKYLLTFTETVPANSGCTVGSDCPSGKCQMGECTVASFVTPTLDETTVTEITRTTATVTSVWVSDGGAPVTEEGFEYNTTGNFATATKVTGIISNGTFTANLSGLLQNTTYYVRSYAKNSMGTGYGSVKEFNTANPGPEICGDGIDNDMDGTVDNHCN